MKDNRKKIVIIMAVVFFFFGSGWYLFKNIPLRTAIFRTVLKGNWYIISEKDTLFCFGYYGVKKLLQSNELEVLTQNSDICNNVFIGGLVARSGVLFDKYVYVACRSFYPYNTSNNEDYVNGRLYVLDRNNLKVVNFFNSDIKLVSAQVYKNKLFVSGLGGFDIYDLSIPNRPRIIHRHRSTEFREFQGYCFFNSGTDDYLAFTHFRQGISIWNITDTKHPSLFKTISLQDSLINGSMLPNDVQCFNIVSDYPFLYATVGPIKENIGTKNDRRGIMVYDVSDLRKVKQRFIAIPPKYWYKKAIGDPEPSYIALYHNKLYTNFGEKGIAVFDITNPEIPKYIKTNKLSNGAFDYVQPIHINYKGIIYGGDYYSSEIYSKQIEN